MTHTHKHTFPAGRYYIGDPCYAINDKGWEELLKNTGYFEGTPHDRQDPKEVNNWSYGAFFYNGRKCFTWGTSYGDGYFLDNKGNGYGVDAGLIGIVPKEAVDKGQDTHGGHFFTYENPFEVWAEDGTFHFGDRVIKTGSD